jgi:hypothetical protein
MKQLTDISGAATKAIADQFTAVSNHIVTSVSEAVRQAAAQIAALSGRRIDLPTPTPIGPFQIPQGPAGGSQGPGSSVPGVPQRSPALPPQGEGVVFTPGGPGVLIQGPVTINVEKLPDWVQTPEQARDFILSVFGRELENVIRAGSRNTALF